MPEKLSLRVKRAVKAAQTEGREETAMALASSVAGMALDAATRIRWDKPLKSAGFGLKKPADIQRFKNNLAKLLPNGADWIAASPISPDNSLAAIAELVAAAKRSTSQSAPAPTYAIPAIVVRSDLSEARVRVANILGQAFADKVSDRFVYRAGMRMKTSPGVDVGRAATALVLEFTEGHEALPEAPTVATRESGDAGIARLLETALRGQEIEGVRARFYSKIATMRADLERNLGSNQAARESAGETAPSTEVCWLNGTMQVLAKPSEVAYCAGEHTVQRIGLPRLLEREMDVSIAAIGAIGFRHANGFDGTGIQIAVIDGECDANHPALAGRIVHKTNFTKESWGNPDPHGTSVAGIVCSTHAVLGGVCPAATILNYKVFTTNPGLQGTDFAASLAIQGALEDGARVANLSWGLGLGTDGDSREARAVNRAWHFGLVLVKSAGNKGPAAGTLTSPADAADVIVVGASSRNGTALEPYSSRGPNGTRPGPDLLAPGGSVESQLQGVLTGGETGAAGWGTSFAAPHVTGLVALLLQQNPSLKPDDLRTLLVTKCTPVTAGLRDAQGHGFVKI